MNLGRIKKRLSSKTACIFTMLAVVVPLILVSYKIYFPKTAIVSRYIFLIFSILGFTGLCSVAKKKTTRIVSTVISCILLFFILLLHCLEIYNYSMQEDFFNYEFYMSMLDVHLLVEQLPYNIKFLTIGLIYIFCVILVFFFSIKAFERNSRKSNVFLVTLSSLVIISLFCLNSTCIGCFVKMIVAANQNGLGKNNSSEIAIDYASFEKVGITTSNVGHDNFVISSEGIKKNLVFIILESFEDNFLDEELFPGLAPNLNRFRKDSNTINFSNMDQYAGSTAISMFQAFWGFNIVPAVGSSSCYRYVNSDALSKFVSLPYIFTKNGYTWEHIQSSDISNFYEALIKEGVSFDYSEQLKQDKSNYKTRDKNMFDYAWKLFQNKMEAGEHRFVISISTMDSHHPNGRTSNETLEYPQKDAFPSDYEFLPLLNATYTTDYYLGEFVDNILKSEEGKNTIIAIMNDHRFMGDAGGVLKKKYRKNIFMILNTDEGRDISLKGCQIDVAPTIVDYFQIKTNYSFPLGVSLLDNEVKKDYDTRTLKKNNQNEFAKYVFQRTAGKTEKNSLVSINKDNFNLIDVFGMTIPNELEGIAAGKMFVVYLSDNLEIEDYKTFSGQSLETQIELMSRCLKQDRNYVFLFQTNKDYEVEELLFNRMQFDHHPSASELGNYGLVYYGKDGKIVSIFSDTPGDLMIDIDSHTGFVDKPIVKLSHKPAFKSFSYLTSLNASHVKQTDDRIDIIGKNIFLTSKNLFSASQDKPLNFSCTIKNIGGSPVRVYSGFTTIKDSADQDNGISEPCRGIVIDAQKGNDYIVVQGKINSLSKNTTIETESLSFAIPNSKQVLAKIASTKEDESYSLADLGPIAVPACIDGFEPSVFTKIMLDSALDEEIPKGTLIKFSNSGGAYIYQEDVVLNPGQDQVLNCQYPQPSHSAPQSSEESVFLKPFIFLNSPDNKSESSVSVFDFSIIDF